MKFTPKNIYKSVAYVFLGIVLLLIILIALAISPLGIKLATNIANNQDGISINDVSGSFYSSIQIGSIDLSIPQVDASVSELNLDLGMNCLFVGEACLDNLSLQSATVVLKPVDSPSEASEPTSEYIELPLQASITNIALGTLEVKQMNEAGDTHKLLVLKDLSLKGEMQDVLNIEYLRLASIDVFTPPKAAQEEADPSNEAPQHWLDALNELSYTPISIPDVFVPINANLNELSIASVCLHSGTSSDSPLGVNSDAMCTDSTQLTASMIEQALALNLSTEPKEQITSEIKLNADLAFNNDFAHQITLDMRPNSGLTSDDAKVLQVNVNGDISKTSLNIIHQKEVLRADVAADISDPQLPVDINIAASQISQTSKAWLPEYNIPVNSLNFTVSGNAQQYDFQQSAQIMQAQASEITASGNVSLNDKRIELESLSTSGDIGSLQGSALARLLQNTQDANTSVSDAGNTRLSVNTNILFNALQLQSVVKDLQSDLNGQFDLNANITKKSIWGNINCTDIEGTLQNYELAMLCDISLNRQGRLEVNELALSQGDNNINADGYLQLPYGLDLQKINDELEKQMQSSAPGEGDADIEQANEFAEKVKSNLDIEINIEDINELYSQAKGSVNGNIEVSGQALRPVLESNIKVDSFVFQQNSVQSIDITANVDASKNWESDISLIAKTVSGTSLLASEINVELQGDLQSHDFSLVLAHPDYRVFQSLSGGLVKDSSPLKWQGVWEDGGFETGFDNFDLVSTSSEDQVNIALSQTEASISAHCWVTSQDAKQTTPEQLDGKAGLCVNELVYQNQIANIDGQLIYDLASPLKYFAPEIVKQGSSLPMSSDIKVQVSPDTGLNVKAYSFISESTVVTEGYSVDLVAMVANFTVQNDMVSTSIYAGTEETGAIGVLSNLNLDPENRVHNGQVKIDNFSLSVLRRFIPGIEELNGEIVGNITFEGELTQPTVNGSLSLDDALIVVDNYPYPISNFNQQIDIVNNVAEIEGEFDLGNGGAEYYSEVSFQDGLMVTGGLKGAGMQLAYQENELLASPDLTFSLTPDDLSLKGEVVVPNADIEMPELPESAKSPSDDTIIIGQKAPEPVLPIGLDVDIKILLDPAELKRVKIAALDLEATLGSDLQVIVKQERTKDGESFTPMQTLVYGSVTTLSGSYEAYGQDLQIREGNIYFSGPPNLPQFDITAVRNPLNTEDNVIAGIRISGNPVIPRVELFSEPTMIQARQLSYLVLGTDIDGGSGEGSSEQVMLTNALVSYGIGNSENGINRLGQSLGFQSLNLQTAGSGENTQVQVAGRISENLQVIYGVGLFEQTTEVILQYQLMPQLFLEAKGGATSAVDLFYEFTRGESQ